ncbi:MAG: M56 family metallopeptidase [Acidobacteriota bacterium]|nr:M56 family metallopeptidase [Acidobacteriota bacterium]
MTFELRFSLVVLATFFGASAIVSLITFAGARAVVGPRAAGGWRPGGLALLRLMPAAVSLALTLLVLAPGYYAHEQRADGESTGYLIAAAALGGVLILLSSFARGTRAILRTARLRQAWLSVARPARVTGAGMPAYEIDVPFPLVAVVGTARPRLFISSIVLRECPAPELAAIIEHERAHVSARDNVVRLMMDAAPDLLALTRVPARIASAWHQAIEHRADDAASTRTDLASALVRVARLATRPGSIALPASALYRGEGIEDRVRRLVTRSQDTARPGRTRALIAACTVVAGAICAAALTGSGSRAAHAVLEAAVSYLP